MNIDKWVHFALVSFLPTMFLCLVLGFACVVDNFDDLTISSAGLVLSIFGTATIIYGWAAFATTIVFYKLFNCSYWLSMTINVAISLYGCFWLVRWLF